MYYVYLIIRQGKTYIGYTDNLIRRLKEHKVTKQELIYYEAYKNEMDARTRERILKQRGQTVRRLKERIRLSLI
ncbi:MAG: GIY-YIG nuclease family protein [Patescibacteria group bacterium]